MSLVSLGCHHLFSLKLSHQGPSSWVSDAPDPPEHTPPPFPVELVIHPTFTARPDLHITANGSHAQACARTGVAGDNAQGLPRATVSQCGAPMPKAISPLPKTDHVRH